MNRPLQHRFVHLNVHSEYSISDGIVRIKPLAAKVAELNQPAVAITDISNLYAAVKFYKACLGSGVKPLIGADVWIENPIDNDPSDRGNPDRVKLFCLDQVGYKNLSKLITEAYLRGQKNNRVVLSWEDLSAFSDGLIALLDDIEGPVANALQSSSDDASALLDRYQQVLPGNRVYLEVSRIGRPGEESYIRQAAQLCADRGIGLVATNRVVYLSDEQFEAHEIRVCINDGRVLIDSRRPRRYTDQQSLRSSEQMLELFEDYPEAIANTVEIAQRCNLFLGFDEDFLPDYPDTTDRSVADLLREQTEVGLAMRLAVPALKDESCGRSGIH